MSILDRILETKRGEIDALKAVTSIAELKAKLADVPPPPSFHDALRAPGAPHLIAEVKKASPSKGLIRPDFDPAWIASRYEDGGAAALSVLTDREYFQGDLGFLESVRAGVSLPLLRKDFILDPIQVYESRLAGASAILLIAAALEPGPLADLHGTAAEAGLDVLVEVHNSEELDTVETCGAPVRIIGVNNRDLRTFSVDLGVTERLAPRLREKYTLVSESGIFTPRDVIRLRKAGASAVLVGESLMRQNDPGRAALELMKGTADPS